MPQFFQNIDYGQNALANSREGMQLMMQLAQLTEQKKLRDVQIQQEMMKMKEGQRILDEEQAMRDVLLQSESAVQQPPSAVVSAGSDIGIMPDITTPTVAPTKDPFQTMVNFYRHGDKERKVAPNPMKLMEIVGNRANLAKDPEEAVGVLNKYYPELNAKYNPEVGTVSFSYKGKAHIYHYEKRTGKMVAGATIGERDDSDRTGELGGFYEWKKTIGNEEKGWGDYKKEMEDLQYRRANPLDLYLKKHPNASIEDYWKDQASIQNQNKTYKTQFVGTTNDGKAVLFNPDSGTFELSELPGDGLTSRTTTPLPTASQDKITGGLNSIKILADLKRIVPKTNSDIPFWSWIKGKGEEFMASAGWGGDIGQFQTLRDRFKLDAQSMVKGTPSNFDIQSVINTLPTMSDSASRAYQKIKLATDLTSREIRNLIAYYKGVNKNMPQDILDYAQSLGINIGSISANRNPWGASANGSKSRPRIVSVEEER